MLDLAEPTVKNHVTAILKALNVSNRTEAVIAAGDIGWSALRVARTERARRGRAVSPARDFRTG